MGLLGGVKKWAFINPPKVPFKAIGYTSLDPSNSDSKTGKNERVRSYQVNFPTCFCLPWRWAVTVARDNRTMCRKSKQKYIKENLRKRNNVIDLCPWLNTHLNIFCLLYMLLLLPKGEKKFWICFLGRLEISLKDLIKKCQWKAAEFHFKCESYMRTDLVSKALCCQRQHHHQIPPSSSLNHPPPHPPHPKKKLLAICKKKGGGGWCPNCLSLLPPSIKVMVVLC